MALTVTDIARSVFGDKRVVIAEIAFDSSYATGGEALTAAMVGLSSIDAVVPAGPAAAAAGATAVTAKFDRTNNKLQAFWTSVTSVATPETLAVALAEVASTTNLAALKVVVFVVGS